MNLESPIQQSQYDSDHIRIPILSIINKNVEGFLLTTEKEILIAQQMPERKTDRKREKSYLAFHKTSVRRGNEQD